MPIVTDEEILSGEAVAIDVQPIGFLLRALGALIDMAISFVVYIAFIFLITALSSQGLLTEATTALLTIAMTVVSFLVLPVTLEVALRGRSVGKLAVGGRIVRVDGGAITFRHSFIRGLLGVLEIYLTAGGLAVLAGALSSRSQRLGDMVAGTYSQRVRVPALVERVPLLPPGMGDWARIADVARLPDRLARRISQFLVSADRLAPGARAHIASDLAAEASAFVSPVPNVAPEALLVAVTVLRRERETRALVISDDRAERLSGRRVRA